MRTTVEIPDGLREKLVEEATRRGEKGYSAVIERALRNYFGGPATTKAEIARQLRGSEKDETTADAEHRRVAAVRGVWRSGKET
ncbi:MAG: ribbon-helix-helix protein, CopG family [Spirochaetaceae bacterium]